MARPRDKKAALIGRDNNVAEILDPNIVHSIDIVANSGIDVCVIKATSTTGWTNVCGEMIFLEKI